MYDQPGGTAAARGEAAAVGYGAPLADNLHNLQPNLYKLCPRYQGHRGRIHGADADGKSFGTGRGYGAAGH